MATERSLTIDCARPGALAAFWAAALGYAERPPPPGFDSWEQWLDAHDVPEEEWDDGAYLSDPAGTRPDLCFLRVPESKAGKNRLHIVVRVGGGRETPWEVRWPRVTAAVERLTATGATVVAEHDLQGRPDHVVMADRRAASSASSDGGRLPLSAQRSVPAAVRGARPRRHGSGLGQPPYRPPRRGAVDQVSGG
jgi:hypothetical protein